MRSRVAHRPKLLSGFEQYRLTMKGYSGNWRQEALDFQLDKLAHCGIQIASTEPKNAGADAEGILANHCDASSIDNNVLVQ